MQWRLVGPFRGGRALAIEGIAGDPATFYFGGVAGGVWRSGNAGRTWEPLTDAQTFASIGALALAPSDPNVIYVGAGEADMRSDITYGNGMWKSTDGGHAWTHIGLDSTRQIARILVDPHDSRTLLVAALGHAYGPNADRGVYRSTDGGQTWQKVLYRNERIGAIDLAWDPKDPHTVYAALWETHRPPWSQYPPIEGPGGGVFKSTDEGLTWTELSGLPKDGGRIGLATVKGVVYAICEGKGLFRSDDGGATWRQTSTDPRLGRGWYFGQVFIDPSNPDVVYAPNVAILRSTDGGKTFTAIKGNPGGDDYHYMWIDPTSSKHVAFASDQGVGVSFDYGATWSEWFNQPTAQFYHVITDNRWPYWIYGAQQDAGSMGVASRSDFGTITYRDWMLPGAGESGMIALDPLDSNIIYGGNTYGGLLRFDRTTNVTEDIQPWPRDAFGVPIDKRKYRFTWTSPLVFDPIDKHTLYFGSQRLLKTTDGGLSWQFASPDLTRSDSGVIYAVAPSPKREGIIWAGTDDGRIQVTLDRGLHWRNVTPPDLAPWSKASIIDASSLDSATAYVAIDRHRLDDIAPYIYRTHDLGAHWSRADQGIPYGAYVRAVRADPVRKGLLYAGTELGVYVSYDDGDHWRSLQLNLPVSPIHDLIVHDGDLIVATHGRSFWVLDDVSPLRDNARGDVHLFAPARAIRVRRSVNQDTPLPPETPHGDNPPAGATIDYYLGSHPSAPIALDILDAQGKVVRRFQSDELGDDSTVSSPKNPPSFTSDWLPRPVILPADSGINRFVWDLRYPRPLAPEHEYSISAIPGAGTVADPEGPFVVPGTYQVRLTVNGVAHTQPLHVVLDPRLRVAPTVLVAQLAVAKRIWNTMAEAQALRNAVGDSVMQSLHVDEIAGGLAKLMTMVESADRPTPAPVLDALADYQSQLTAAIGKLDLFIKPAVLP
jgi:photosystem II stability/assembly factor-like uncharacterized protein